VKRQPSAEVAELSARAADLTAPFRSATFAEALGCSMLMVWNWRTGAKIPSQAQGRKGRRFFDVLRALAAAEEHRAAAAEEARLMDEEGHGERWAVYDRRWTWVQSPTGPKVVRVAASRRRQYAAAV
jgi:hypothetical protein